MPRKLAPSQEQGTCIYPASVPNTSGCWLAPLLNQPTMRIQFGEGQRISIASSTDDTSQVKAIVSRMLPAASLIAESGRSLIYAVPFSSTAYVSLARRRALAHPTTD